MSRLRRLARRVWEGETLRELVVFVLMTNLLIVAGAEHWEALAVTLVVFSLMLGPRGEGEDGR